MTSTYRVDKYGNKIWYNENGQYHREDGPALEQADGHKEWYLNNRCHREDGPAVEYVSGDKFWYLNGQRHREDGPALEWSNGHKAWYLNGKEYIFKDYCNELLNRKLISEINLTLFRLRYGE